MLGRIYKLEGGGKFYIGSTTCNLKNRLKHHRSKSKEDISKNRALYLHFRELGWENTTIILLEEFEVLNRRELYERECEFIKQFIGTENCLNTIRSAITSEEKKARNSFYTKKRRQENPDYERNRLQEWRKKNPEKYKEQNRRYLERKKLLTSSIK